MTDDELLDRADELADVPASGGEPRSAAPSPLAAKRDPDDDLLDRASAPTPPAADVHPDVQAAREELARVKPGLLDKVTGAIGGMVDTAKGGYRAVKGAADRGVLNTLADPHHRRELERGLSDMITFGLAEKAANAVDPSFAAAAAEDKNAAPDDRALGNVVGMFSPGAASGVAKGVGKAVGAATKALPEAGLAARVAASRPVAQAATGAGVSGATTLGQDLAAGVPLKDALSDAGDAALVGGTVGAGLGTATSIPGAAAGAISKRLEGARGRLAERTRELLGDGTGINLRRAIATKADEVDSLIERHPEIERLAADPKKLVPKAEDVLAAKGEQMRHLVGEKNAAMAENTSADLLRQAAEARAQAQAIRDALPDAREKVTPVSDKMIVGSEGTGPLDRLAAKVERKRLKYESIVNKEDRARAKDAYLAAKDELSTAKKSARASEIAEARGDREPGTYPEQDAGEVQLREMAADARGHGAVPVAVDEALDKTAAIPTEPMAKMVGQATGAGEDIAAGQARRASLPDDFASLDKTQRIEVQTPVKPTAAYAAKLEAKASAMEKQAEQVQKSGGGIRLGDVEASLRTLANEVEKDPARVKTADAIRAELEATKRSWGEDPNAIIPTDKVRKYASGLQKRGYSYKTEGTAAEAAQEASKAVLDHVNKHVTGMSYADGIKSSDPAVQRYYQLNDDSTALQRIIAAAEAKNAAPAGGQGNRLKNIAKGVIHSAHLGMSAASHSPLPTIATLALTHGVPFVSNQIDKAARATEGARGRLASAAAPVTEAASVARAGVDRAAARLVAGVVRGENHAALIQQAKQDGIDPTAAASIIANLSPRRAEASP